MEFPFTNFCRLLKQSLYFKPAYLQEMGSEMKVYVSKMDPELNSVSKLLLPWIIKLYNFLKVYSRSIIQSAV